jgi:hypothetical protein
MSVLETKYETITTIVAQIGNQGLSNREPNFIHLFIHFVYNYHQKFYIYIYIYIYIYYIFLQSLEKKNFLIRF